MKYSKFKLQINKKILDQSEGILMLIITIMLVIDVLIGILARFVHFQHVFATELGKYLFIWLCLVGISAAAKDNQHIRISFIVEKLPINPKVTWILSQLIFLVFSILMFYVGLRLTWMHFSMSKSAVGFNFPMYVFTTALPLGFLLTSLRLIKDIVENINGSKSGGWNINQMPVDELSTGERSTIKTNNK